jgi:WS/DGAT/MGAT family acyltransferase
MEQLPGSDAVFLAMETPEAPAHVGGLTVLDPTDAPSFGFERLCAVIDERIRLAPRFVRTLREAPLGLDRPYLVDDPTFDVRRHVRRIAVPSPGGLRELGELASYLFSRPLERTRPLWEIWFIEGVADGRVALFMKSHHCLMDGQGGAGLGELLCDLEPAPAGGPLVTPAAGADEGAFGDLEIALRAAGHLAEMPGRLLRLGLRLARTGAAQTWLSLGGAEGPPLPTAVPPTRFNRPVGPQRAFAGTSVPLADVKRVRRELDVTVNDVVLALVGSAVRRWLVARGELPERPLVALIAVSRRAEGDDSVNNQIAAVPMAWATDLEDPVERLLQIHRNAEKAKAWARRREADTMEAMETLPPAVTNLFMRSLGARLAPAAAPGNVVVSNVRGTPVPLYTAGARIECMYPMSLLAAGQGMNATVVSYMDRMDVGFTVDPSLVPDPWELADAVPEALRELVGTAASRRRDAA